MKYGYARVSTEKQDTALQRSAFRLAGIRRVVEEKRSGVAARPLLEELLVRLQPGDELVVYKIDRLARSLVDLLNLLGRVKRAGATFRSLTEPIETVTPAGRMMVQMLGAVAEFEREVIRERCCAGVAAAREKGVVFGRPVRLERSEVLRLRGEGYTWRAIQQRLGASRSSLHAVASGQRKVDGGPGVPRKSRER